MNYRLSLKLKLSKTGRLFVCTGARVFKPLPVACHQVSKPFFVQLGFKWSWHTWVQFNTKQNGGQEASGLYYKPMTIVNDDSRVVNKLEASLTNDASHHLQLSRVYSTSHLLIKNIRDDISIKSSNIKFNINDVCNLISMSSEHFN